MARKARSSRAEASGWWSQSSESGMVWAVLITHTPGSVLSISTVRPAYSLPSEIWPLTPTCFATSREVFMQVTLSCQPRPSALFVQAAHHPEVQQLARPHCLAPAAGPPLALLLKQSPRAIARYPCLVVVAGRARSSLASCPWGHC